MASNESNALAELAERLDKGRWNLDVNDYIKAIRIIAELAKVTDEEAALFSMEYLNPDEARRIARQREGNCILKCRAIAAEEGAKE